MNIYNKFKHTKIMEAKYQNQSYQTLYSSGLNNLEQNLSDFIKNKKQEVLNQRYKEK